MKIVRIPSETGGFQEDKDLGKVIRTEQILPALAAGEVVRLDFSKVSYATQSFVHALIGEALKIHGEAVLERLEFHKCSEQLQTVIELVVGYSLGGFSVPESSGGA